MRLRLVPLALLTILGLALFSPGARAQYNGSMRPSFYTPSNFGTPNASAFRPSSFGMSRPSFGMPNPYRYMPSYSTLNSGTPTPIGVVSALPGTLINGVNYGAPPAANMPLPADGSPLTRNVPQPSTAALEAAAAQQAEQQQQQQAGPPTPENAAQQPPVESLPTDATTQATYGSLVQGTFVPNALTTPFAVPATPLPTTAPVLAAPLAVYTPSYGSFAPAPRYPASFSSALNRVYGRGY